MNRRLRHVLLTLLPPLGAALGALALLDFAAYGRFVWAKVGGLPAHWWPFEVDAPPSLLWLSGAAAFAFAVCFFLLSWTRRQLAWAGPAGWLFTVLGLAAHLLAALLARATVLDPRVFGCECVCTDGDLGLHELDRQLFVADTGLLVTGGTLVLCAILGARRRPAEWSLAVVAGLAMAGTSLAWHSEGPWGGAPEFARASLLAGQVYDAARAGVLVLTLGLVGLRVRRGWQLRTRGGLLLSMLGGVAFATTRNLAFDAQHELPVVVEPYGLSRDVVSPSLSQCDSNDGWLFPSVLGTAEGFYVSGTAMGRPGSAELRSSTFEKLSDLRKQYEDLHSYASDPSPPPRTVDLVFDRALPMSDIIPVLQAARAAGYDLPNLASSQERSVDSRTAGRLVRSERCARRFSFDPDGISAARFKTWGELAKALDEGEVRLAVPSPELPECEGEVIGTSSGTSYQLIRDKLQECAPGMPPGLGDYFPGKTQPALAPRP